MTSVALDASALLALLLGEPGAEAERRWPDIAAAADVTVTLIR